MAIMAAELPAEGGHLTPGTRMYLLATAMLGAVVQKDYAITKSSWSRYGPTLFGGREPYLLFRLLAAEASQRWRGSIHMDSICGTR